MKPKIKKKIKYSFLQERLNPETGKREFLAIVVSKQRRGCPSKLIISIGHARVISKKSKVVQ